MSNEKNAGEMDITATRVEGSAQDEDDDFETGKEMGPTGTLGNAYRQEGRLSTTQEQDREEKDRDRIS